MDQGDVKNIEVPAFDSVQAVKKEKEREEKESSLDGIIQQLFSTQDEREIKVMLR